MSDGSEDSEEDSKDAPRTAAPPNPFSRTLETMERSGKETSSSAAATAVAATGRASLDVEAFKRLLMTGNAGVADSSTASLSVPAPSVHHGLGDGGSSTDASSLSRQSMFDPTQELHQHQETPRTSHEISEADEDPRGLAGSTQSRKKPPPPHSKHGKLIQVELKGDPTPKPLSSPPAVGPGMPQINFSPSSPSLARSLSDINKPLPPAPVRTSDLDAESIFDTEAAGKIPEPPSPGLPAKTDKKAPPPPPLARRHSQMVSNSKAPRTEASRAALRQADDDSSSVASSDHGRPRSSSEKIPPPPPSRRPGSIRQSSHQAPLQSTPTLPKPSPPLSRNPSVRQHPGRPPSVISVDSSSTATRRSSIVPPPPPPPRHSRSSIDGGSRSGEPTRPSIDSNRRGSGASFTIPRVEHSPPDMDDPNASGHGQDILADLTALQRDIDALMVRSEKQSVS